MRSCSSSVSSKRTGRSWPNGGTPPTPKPVAARTSSGEAWSITAESQVRARASGATPWAPDPRASPLLEALALPAAPAVAGKPLGRLGRRAQLHARHLRELGERAAHVPGQVVEVVQHVPVAEQAEVDAAVVAHDRDAEPLARG